MKGETKSLLAPVLEGKATRIPRKEGLKELMRLKEAEVVVIDGVQKTGAEVLTDILFRWAQGDLDAMKFWIEQLHGKAKQDLTVTDKRYEIIPPPRPTGQEDVQASAEVVSDE